MNSFLKAIIALVLFTNARAQAQSFDDCKANMFFVSAQQSAQFNGSLQSWFENALQNKLGNVRGFIGLQLLIDTSGNVCCKNIDNKTGKDISALELPVLLKTMPAWQPASDNGYKVNFSALVTLEIGDNGMQVNYRNQKALMAIPAVNRNATNQPRIARDRKTKTTWKVWTFDNSMIPGNMSRKVAQDSKGTIWYCTDNGLVRIHGDNWLVYTGRNTPALSGEKQNTWTTELSIDRNDDIWVQSFDGRVRYDGIQWKRFDTEDARFKRIFMDNLGYIWTHADNQLMRFDGQQWTNYPGPAGIDRTNVREVYVDKEKNIWLATEKGIHKLGNGQWISFTTGNSAIPNNDISCIKGDKLGNIYAGTSANANNALIKIDATGQVTIYPTSVVWQLEIDPATQHVWMASRGEGLLRFDGKKIDSYNTDNSILPHNTVTSVLIDQNGDKWLSTFGGLVYTNLK